MGRLCVAVLPALLLINASAFAQGRAIEVQGGAGYVLDAAEGPSVPAVNAAAVAWLTRGWGLGVRLSEGLTDDRGSRDLRIWALTSQWRWPGRGAEVNLGLGVGGSGWRDARGRSGVGFAAIDLLVGRHLTGPWHVKAGFTSGLMDDSHPFQPVVLLAWKP